MSEEQWAAVSKLHQETLLRLLNVEARAAGSSSSSSRSSGCRGGRLLQLSWPLQQHIVSAAAVTAAAVGCCEQTSPRDIAAAAGCGVASQQQQQQRWAAADMQVLLRCEPTAAAVASAVPVVGMAAFSWCLLVRLLLLMLLLTVTSSSAAPLGWVIDVHSYACLVSSSVLQMHVDAIRLHCSVVLTAGMTLHQGLARCKWTQLCGYYCTCLHGCHCGSRGSVDAGGGINTYQQHLMLCGGFDGDQFGFRGY